MPKHKVIAPQAYTISPSSNPILQPSLNLQASDELVKNFGIKLVHYKCLPSPLGQFEKGAYRRGEMENIDNILQNGILSNGFIYKKAGCFTGALIGNSTQTSFSINGGMEDFSHMRLILPRFYEDNSRIYLSPGDRIYLADEDADVLVATFEKVEFNSEGGVDVLVFPAKEVEYLIDSQGIEYKCGVDFDIDEWGRIVWKVGGRNPGVDPVTGKGRVYSIRYKYVAFFYVAQLINEIRITNVTEGDERRPERMPYHALLVREYVFHKKADVTPVQSPNNPYLIGQARPVTNNSTAGYNDRFIKVNMDDE